MDREIKFRAWDEERGEFWYSDDGRGFRFIISPKGGCYVEKLSNDETITEGPWSQYTGLKDKNGKEIYEGDLIKDNSGIMKAMRVEWGEHRPGFYDVVGFSFENIKNIEVIGNIYENPELIK